MIYFLYQLNERVPMLEKLFGSKARASLLTFFCLNPGKQFYVREIERLTNLSYISVSNELKNLQEFGLLKSKFKGNQKNFWIDEHFVLYEELQKIILKTEGVTKTIMDTFSSLKNVDFLFIYGSFASGKANVQSDLDVFIVGNASYDEVIDIIVKNEKETGRQINFTMYKQEDLLSRIKNQDSFIMNVVNEPKIMLIGSENEFKALGT
jgi:predicted nucleotidyltransferase